MVVVAAVLAVVAIALAVELVRTRARLDALASELEGVRTARTEAEAARRRSETETATARAEREDALDREKRAKREAADVSRRLQQEHDAHARTEQERDRLAGDLEALRAQLAEVQARADQRAGGDVEQLWQLALAGVRRTWEVSVAPSPGMPSPIDGALDPLRAAVEVEVDAAREEAGAAIDLEWAGDAVAPPAVALRALSITQELIARLAKVSDQAVLRVASDPEGVTIEVEGTDADGGSVVPTDVAAEHQVAPGRYVLTA